MAIGATNGTGLVTPFATLTVTYPQGSACTCTDSKRTLSAKNENGVWTFNIPYAAAWTVSCSNGTETASTIVEIVFKGQKESISIDYKDYVINNGVLIKDFRISTTTATYEQNGDCLVFKSTVASSGNGSITINEGGQDIDFSNRSILCFDTEAISPRSGTLDYVTWGVTGASSVQKNLGVDTPIERQIVSIDISNVSSGTISLFISDNPATVELKIYNAWFE